jgi:hypothetical protein
MTPWLAPAYLALSCIILIWDIVLAGRIAQLREAPRVLQAVSGLAALLVLPGVLLALATSTILTGRAVVTMDWVWPVVLLLFAFQAVYALVHRLVNLWWGIPIAAYDLLIAAVGLIRYLVAHGYAVPDVFLTLLAAQSTSLVLVTQSPDVLATPFYISVPMVSPAFPALRRLTASFRLFMSSSAFLWVLVMAAFGMPRAIDSVRAVENHAGDRLRERPEGDFAVGVKILPDILNQASPTAIRRDFALTDTLDVDVISVVVTPGATRLVIDSLARVLDRTRHDSTTLIVTLGYRGKLIPELSPLPLDVDERLATLDRVVKRIHPDIVLPAEDPYGSGARAVGRLPVERWREYLTKAARVAKAADRRVKVGVSVSITAFTRDSALYAWAAKQDSPMDVVGFSFFPTPYVGGDLDALERAADRWMRATPPTKDHWVFATGAYPLAYGERIHERTIWQVLAWATEHPAIKGLVVYEAGDYGQARGLRAPDGRLRSAALAVGRAIRGLRESTR